MNNHYNVLGTRYVNRTITSTIPSSHR